MFRAILAVSSPFASNVARAIEPGGRKRDTTHQGRGFRVRGVHDPYLGCR
ncbi:MAG: hypothetical protein AB9819_02125 [Methanomassiliicoccales archaeon]